MSNHFTIGIAAAILFAPVGPATIASAQSAHGTYNQEVVAFCKFKVTQIPTVNVGECMGHVQTLFNSPNGYPPHECDAMLETDPATFFLYFDSFSDCVRTLDDS